MPLHLDRIDWSILEALAADARLSFSALGRRVGLSQPAAAERVRALEAAGVIRGYRIDVDYEKLGLPVTAVIRVAAKTVDCSELGPLLGTYPEIVECHRVTGGDSVVATAVVGSIHRLEALIDRLMKYGTPTTSVVLSTPVRARMAWPETLVRQTPDATRGRRRGLRRESRDAARRARGASRA